MKLPEFSSPIEMYRYIEKDLYTAVVSDILDELGLRDRVARSDIRPIYPGHTVAGRAMTMLWMDVFEVHDEPYKVEIAAMDALCPGDVVIHATGSAHRSAPWGALMTTAAIARGARGAILDGNVRDAKKIIDLGFPVFATGFCPLDSKGRSYMVDYGCPIECGGMAVKTGDIVFADFDGVVVIPKEAEDSVLRLAMEKVHNENSFLSELKQGHFLRDVYAKYKIL